MDKIDVITISVIICILSFISGAYIQSKKQFNLSEFEAKFQQSKVACASLNSNPKSFNLYGEVTCENGAAIDL